MLEQIKLDLPDFHTEEFDDSNVLALPSRKRRTKKLIQDEQKVKPLTKKERKRLEKIIAVKDKKAKVK